MTTLCQTCIDTILGRTALIEVAEWDMDSEYHKHHGRLEDLESSAERGCPICYSLHKDLMQDKRQDTEQFLSTERSLPFSECRLAGSDDTDKDWMFMVNGYSTPALRFMVEPAADIARFYAKAPCGSSTGSLSAMNTVRQWLEDCTAGHPRCNAGRDTSFYPTRLFDVGTSLSSGICLISTANIQPTGGYMTLSHRWRGDMPLKLTQSSYEAFMNGIPIDQMPPTFRDAVEVARQLGKRYLWIDCLCIFQNAEMETDWLHEAPDMGKIYSNTFLNLSAIGADSSSGLFFERNGSLEVLPIVLPKAIFHKILPAYTDGIFAERYYERDRFEFAELNSRAWVFQERWLSPRILHFGTGQLLWECSQRRCSERFPDGAPPGWQYTAGSMDPHMTCRAAFATYEHGAESPSSSKNQYQDLLERHKIWNNVVSRYSGCNLTYQKDRAIALTGVAKKLQPVFEDQYIAGMWRCGIEQQFMWSRPIRGRTWPRPRSNPYIAPTWSWLSIMGSVFESSLAPADPIYARVLSVSVTPKDGDEMGALADGCMTLQGHLQRAIVQSNGIEGKVRLEGKSDEWDLWLDVDVSGQSVYLSVHGYCYGMVVGTALRTNHEPDLNPERDSHKMLLLKCIEPKKGTYERFGMAELYTWEVNDRWFWNALAFNYETASNIPGTEYDAAESLHTITVI